MTSPTGRRGYLLLLILLMLLCILTEQYWIARLLPSIGNLGGVQPMIVFLDIPLRLPVIDWLPVGLLLTAGYLVVVAPDITRHHPEPARLLRKKALALFTGWWILLFCFLAGGFLFEVFSDLLPKEVRNGIDSFGLKADVFLPWPGETIVHLHGGMLMALTGGIGFWILGRKASVPLPAAKPVPEPAPTRKSRVAVEQAPAQTPKPGVSAKLIHASQQHVAVDHQPVRTPRPRITADQEPARTPKPRPTTGNVHVQAPPKPAAIVQEHPSRVHVAPSLVSVVAPQIPGKGNSYPCIVKGAIKPA